jgi:hypothetical protein
VKRRQSPPEKKATAYRKDHVVAAEYPHAFRRNWPRKRHYANQAYRHRVHDLLQAVKETCPQEDDGAEVLGIKAVRRREVRKWGATSLRDRVADRQQMRVERTGWNFFRAPYVSARDRERFVAFLTTLTQLNTPNGRDVAQFFQDMLATPAHPSCERQIFNGMARRRSWLRAFLRDEPAWGPRLQAWIVRNTK